MQISDVTPVLGDSVQSGDRILTEHGIWSSKITHFVEVPAGSVLAAAYGWNRVAYSGGIPLRPLSPHEPVCILATPAPAPTPRFHIGASYDDRDGERWFAFEITDLAGYPSTRLINTGGEVRHPDETADIAPLAQITGAAA